MDIPPLNEAAMDAAFAATPHGRHGKLEGLAVWLSGVQGAVPPRPLARVRVALSGSSALAADVAVSGGYDDGAAAASREVDGGADAFVVAAPPSVRAAALVAALTDAEPVEVVAPGPHWARQVGEVRDLLRSARGAGPSDLAVSLGDAALVGFVTEAARRRTPVLLDGMAPAAAALAAERLAPGAVTYCVAAHLTPEPAHRLALTALGLEPLLDLGIRAEGGALHALPLLAAAVALVRDERG